MVWTEERRRNHSRALKRAWKAKRENQVQEAGLDVNGVIKKLSKTAEYVRIMGGIECATAAIEAYERLGCDMRSARALFRRMSVVGGSTVMEDSNAGSNGA